MGVGAEFLAREPPDVAVGERVVVATKMARLVGQELQSASGVPAGVAFEQRYQRAGLHVYVFSEMRQEASYKGGAELTGCSCS